MSDINKELAPRDGIDFQVSFNGADAGDYTSNIVVQDADDSASKVAVSVSVKVKETPAPEPELVEDPEKIPEQNSQTLNMIINCGMSLRRTDKQGTIIMTTDGKTISWNVDPQQICREMINHILKRKLQQRKDDICANNKNKRYIRKPLYSTYVV